MRLYLIDSSRVAVASLCLTTIAMGCGGDDSLDTTPTTAAVTVTTATTGAEQDPDGYTVQIDAAAPEAIGIAASIENTTLSPGNHSVQLSGVAPNCMVAENPQVLTVAAGASATVAFQVTCAATTGTLDVATTTTGPSPDPDGYAVTIDGADQGTLAVSATLSVPSLAPGEHTVGLSGVAGNCQVQADNPRPVTVTAGSSVNASFTVTCAAPAPNAGSLLVGTTTAGPDPDPNGYTVAIDGETTQPIGVASRATVTNIPAGDHTVRLANVAGNCSVQGNNPRPVNVAGGGTAEVTFGVTCSAITGTIDVAVATSGSPQDPDGYTVTLEGREPSLAVPSSGTTSFSRVTPGDRKVILTNLAPNCSVAGGESKSVTVNAGAKAQLSFAISCAETTGSIQVSTVVTGTALDPDGYTVTVDGGSPQSIDNNASSTIGALTPGSHAVALEGIAANCQLSGEPSSTVTVDAGVQSKLSFTLDCPGSGVTQWTPMSGGGDIELTSVWGTGPTDVFAVGSAANAGGGVILHYDGTSWSEQLRRPYAFGPATFNGVWANTATDVYAAGILVEENATGSVYHYDGSTWTPMTLPRLGADELMFGVWGLSGTEIFAFGVNQFGFGEYTPLIFRYDGTAWQTFPVPTGDMYINDMWGTSTSDLYAVGGRFESPTQLVMHYNGTAWSVVQEFKAETGAHAVWSSSPTDVFVGQTIPALLHFDGAAWSPMTTPTQSPIYNLWGTAANDVFAVTDNVILHFDGTAWTSTTSLTPHRLNAVWGSSATDVFAVGQNGSIMHGTP
jgi:hypothetical protein